MQNRNQTDSLISKLTSKLNWRDALGFLFAFSPAIVLLIMINQHAVNVPVWDDWEMLPLIEKAYDICHGRIRRHTGSTAISL